MRYRDRALAALAVFLVGVHVQPLFAEVPATVDIIVDNQDTEGVEIHGDWKKRGSPDLGFGGNGGWWLDDNKAGTGHSVVFTPNLPEAGDYEVYGRWITNPNHASNARFTINHSGASTEIDVNQQQNGRTWYDLGKYHFDAGTSGNVTISDEGANGFVIAETIRFIKESPVVDFGANQGPVTHRGTGVLSSFSSTKPGPDLVDPLHPQMFRVSLNAWVPGSGAIENYQRMHSLGKYIQCVLSDTWGYPNAKFGWPGGPQDPDFSHWRQYIADCVQKAKDHNLQLQYDIWNEPDWYMFWPQNRASERENYRLAWLNAYKTIRSLQPNADIVGPSTGWREAWIENFLLWARDHHCLPDVVSWHQFAHSAEESAVVTENAATLRKWMAANGIKISRISINEHTGSDLEANPGFAVWMLDDLERAKVESAAHACWTDPDGSVEFHNFSLDGLLTSDLQPRSSWWTYKYYGDMSGELAKVNSGAGSVRGLAAYDGKKKEFRLLFGRALGTGPEGSGTDVPVVLENVTAPGFFTEGETVRVQARRVADSKWSAVTAEPPLTLDAPATIQHGEITFTLPSFGPSDSYAVVVAKAKPLTKTSLSLPVRFLPALLGSLPAQTAAAPPAATLKVPTQAADIYKDWPFDSAEAVRRQKETADKLGLPVEFQMPLAGNQNIVFELIPAGTFIMGSPPEEPLRGGNELQHPVQITRPFYMGKYLVTQGEWTALMPDNPSLFKGKPDSDRRPVEHVPFTTAESHHGVDELLSKVQALAPAGWKVRLPTEAEWEYACRAGTATAYFFGDHITEAQANYDGTAVKEGGTETGRVYETTVVGRYPANAWGLYDMAGNTMEWCQDWFDTNFYKNSPVEDPNNTTAATWRVLRGGCWIHGPKMCRSAARYASPPNYFAGSIGFRLVLAAQ